MIPYIAPTTHYNVLSGYYDWGTVFCYIYSPLATGTGASTATYTCWLSFDDFEVEVPIVPQSNMKGAKKNILKKYRVNSIKSNLDSEVNDGSGPISSVLSSVSSVAAALYSVPMLAPVAGPVAWMTNLASGLASAFGWSKPNVDSPVCRFYQQPHAYMVNTNEPDLVNNMGLIADNRVSVMPDVNLSGVDEMSHNFIKRQKAYYTHFTWTTSTLPGNLFNIAVEPIYYQVPHTSIPFGATSVVNASDYTPIAFLAKLYENWRGSIEITIKIVKTEFHTGRLIFSFSPQLIQGPITNSNTDYIHREIIDLRDGYEFVIKVPYCHNTMYRSTTSSADGYFMMSEINVLNELVAPDTCAQFVDILYEVRGGPDMEFQVPRPFNMVPVQMIAPQSGGDGQAELVMDSPIGGSVIHDPAKMAAQLCMGESSTSLLQLLKRYIKLSSTDGSYVGNNTLYIYPYLFGGYYVNGTIGAGTTAFLTGDYVGLFASLYAHSRGAVKYRIMAGAPNAPFTTQMWRFDVINDRPFDSTILAFQSQLGPSSQDSSSEFQTDISNPTAFDPQLAYGAAGLLPMYSRTFCRLNRIFYTNLNNDTLSFFMPDVNRFKLAFSCQGATIGQYSSLARCVSDDFQFSFWLGVPTLGWLKT